MEKQEFIKFIESLPDHMEVCAHAYRESTRREGEWKSQGGSTVLGGVYQQTVDNELTFTIHFKMKYEGEFRRTQINRDGEFLNIHSIKEQQNEMETN